MSSIIPRHIKQDRLAKTRYRPGKSVPEQESESEEEEPEPTLEPRRPKQPQAKPASQKLKQPLQPSQGDDADDDDDEEGFETDEDDAPITQHSNLSTSHTKVPGESTRTRPLEIELQPRRKHDEESASESEDDDDGEEDDESSSGEEESSEEEEPRRKFARPVFVKKSDRNPFKTLSTQQPGSIGVPQDQSVTDVTPEADDHVRRHEQVDEMIKDKLKRDAIARAQGRRAWDDDDDLDPQQLVDDTDGLDPEQEHQAWRLREFRRLKRARDEMIAREIEIEEVERRRNLSKEDREKEDREHLEKQRTERDQDRGQGQFLGQYRSKGAFSHIAADDEHTRQLLNRDLTGAKYADAVDKSALPSSMQIRDLTKLGKKGQSRRHVLTEVDSGHFGRDIKSWRGAGDNRGRSGFDRSSGDGFSGGVDDRFRPDSDWDRDRDRGPTGANNIALGQRRAKSRSRSRSRSESRSRTPPPRRKRSPSPYGDRDKRRRVEAL